MWKCCKREWNQRSLKRSACTCMLASVKDCRCLHLLEQGRWAMAPWRKVRNYNYRNRTVFWNFLTSQTFWCSQFSSGLWQWLWLSFDMNPWLTGNPFFFDSRPWFLVIFSRKTIHWTNECNRCKLKTVRARDAWSTRSRVKSALSTRYLCFECLD